MSDRTWTIGELAAEFGTTLRTIRFYEDQGLLAPERAGTARVFHDRDRVRLQLILRGKRLGFTLAEIAHILGLYDETPGRARSAGVPDRRHRPAARARCWTSGATSTRRWPSSPTWRRAAGPT